MEHVKQKAKVSKIHHCARGRLVGGCGPLEGAGREWKEDGRLGASRPETGLSSIKLSDGDE